MPRANHGASPPARGNGKRNRRQSGSSAGKMDARRLERMEELGRLYAFIDDIPNARLRLIFSLRYLDGLTWQQIAFKIGEYDEQIPRRLHNQALKRMLGCDRAG